MSVQQSLSKNNFWGLVEQKGPWRQTRTDVGRSRSGGVRHPGHNQWKVMINPYHVESQKEAPGMSRIVQRTINTRPLKFSVRPSQKSKGVGPIGVGSREVGHPGFGGRKPGSRNPQDENVDEFNVGPGLADNNQDEYERIDRIKYKQMTQGVNLPGGSFGFSGDSTVPRMEAVNVQQSEAAIGNTSETASQTMGRIAQDVRTVVGPRAGYGLSAKDVLQDSVGRTIETQTEGGGRTIETQTDAHGPVVDPAMMQELYQRLTEILQANRHLDRQEHQELANALVGIDGNTANILKGLQGASFVQQLTSIVQVQQSTQNNVLNQSLFMNQQAPPPSTAGDSMYPKLENIVNTRYKGPDIPVEYPQTNEGHPSGAGAMVPSGAGIPTGAMVPAFQNTSASQGGNGTLQITAPGYGPGHSLAIEGNNQLAIEAPPSNKRRRVKQITIDTTAGTDSSSAPSARNEDGELIDATYPTPNPKKKKVVKKKKKAN